MVGMEGAAIPDFSGLSGGATETAGINAASSLATIATASGSVNTKGNWAQLIAATARAAAWISVTISVPNGTRRYLVDIGIGAAASEVVIVPNLCFQPASGSNAYGYTALLPVSIPAGTRIAARCQSSSASATIQVQVVLIAPTMTGPSSLGSVTAYGVDTSDSGATAVDPGGTANTKGSWVELTAATTAPIRWLVVFAGGDTGARASAQNWLIDIGIGAAASEVVLLADLAAWSGSTLDTPSPSVWVLPVSIQAGERIAARCQCSVNTATERLIDVAVYGVS